MDKFDQYTEQMKGFGPEEVRKLIEDYKKRCICATCPTYNECTARKRELLFCLVGRRGQCQQDELGCVCPDCPLTPDLDLKNTYYCTQGSEKEMRGPK